jgi:hypothetical protein
MSIQIVTKPYITSTHSFIAYNNSIAFEKGCVRMGSIGTAGGCGIGGGIGTWFWRCAFLLFLILILLILGFN